jgi:hypothetical protein
MKNRRHELRMEGSMFHFRFSRIHAALSVCLLMLMLFGGASRAMLQTQRTPSDTVREFYKAMREHRFKEAWALTIYKPAVDGLNAEEFEDLRPDFEEKAAAIPEAVEISGEQISGDVATVFVKVPISESTPQNISQPVNLIKSGGAWIIGTEADQAEVKKKGRRFFLDALIVQHHSDIEDLLKRLIAVQIVYAQQHDAFGDLTTLIAAGLLPKAAGDPKDLGYNFHLAVGRDGKTYVAGAEPTRYGHTGKLSYWMDQTGTIKSVDNAGKPISGPK